MMPRPRAAAADLTTAWQGDNERGDGGRNCRAVSVGEDAEDSAPRRRRRAAAAWVTESTLRGGGDWCCWLGARAADAGH